LLTNETVSATFPGPKNDANHTYNSFVMRRLGCCIHHHSGMGPQSSLSPLLRAAEQLGEDWWCTGILPRLKGSEGAAANAALSCKLLRYMCQCGATQLCMFSSDFQDTAALARVPAKFRACQGMCFEMDSSEDLACHLPAALDALQG
jgi:hypothetical protein